MRRATAFMGSTLEQQTFVHHCWSIVRTTLTCLRFRISRRCSRYIQARVVRWVVISPISESRSVSAAVLRRRESLRSVQRIPFKAGSRFCSARRVRSSAWEACWMTWNLTKVTRAWGGWWATPPLDEGARHVERHRPDGLGVAPMGLECLGQMSDGARIALLGHRDDRVPGRVGGKCDIVMSPGPGGLIDGKTPHFRKILLADGKLHVALAQALTRCTLSRP